MRSAGSATPNIQAPAIHISMSSHQALQSPNSPTGQASQRDQVPASWAGFLNSGEGDASQLDTDTGSEARQVERVGLSGACGRSCPALLGGLDVSGGLIDNSHNNYTCGTVDTMDGGHDR